MPGFSFNQYLLTGNEPVLLHTGSIDIAEKLVSEIGTVLGSKPLAYIFVSHFESDECGGLKPFIQRYPEVQVVCSQVTGRQLAGFGMLEKFNVKAPGQLLKGDGFELEFISYPSEMHLWEGLLTYETKRGVFFSSDLVMRAEAPADANYIITSGYQWSEILGNINERQVPSSPGLEAVKEDLAKLAPKYVAAGHGPFIRLV